MIDHKPYYAHRLAWLYEKGVWPPGQIDHKKCERGDNRFSNLRCATSSQNNRNASLSKSNTSGVKGVSLKKQTGKWCASFKHEGKHVHVGYFFSIEDAEAAIKQKREELHGEFTNHG